MTTNNHRVEGTRLLVVVCPGKTRGFDTGSGAGGIGFRWRLSSAKIIVRVRAALSAQVANTEAPSWPLIDPQVRVFQTGTQGLLKYFLCPAKSIQIEMTVYQDHDGSGSDDGWNPNPDKNT